VSQQAFSGGSDARYSAAGLRRSSRQGEFSNICGSMIRDVDIAVVAAYPKHVTVRVASTYRESFNESDVQIAALSLASVDMAWQNMESIRDKYCKKKYDPTRGAKRLSKGNLHCPAFRNSFNHVFFLDAASAAGRPAPGRRICQRCVLS
jgi:hypothetical protein